MLALGKRGERGTVEETAKPSIEAQGVRVSPRQSRSGQAGNEHQLFRRSDWPCSASTHSVPEDIEALYTVRGIPAIKRNEQPP